MKLLKPEAVRILSRTVVPKNVPEPDDEISFEHRMYLSSPLRVFDSVALAAMPSHNVRLGKRRDIEEMRLALCLTQITSLEVLMEGYKKKRIKQEI